MDVETFLNPISALIFVQLDRLYLLAGEGQYLKIFDVDSSNFIVLKQIFAQQAIHGISCFSSSTGHNKSIVILIWGGSSVCALEISSAIGDSAPNVKILVNEVKVEDWILDACLIPSLPELEANTPSWTAVLVTAHNEILSLKKHSGTSSNSNSGRDFQTLTRGLNSMLYSAHILCEDPHHIIIASGTVTGEVLVWSVTYDASSESMAKAQFHYRLLGHEGSVFGVRISSSLGTPDGPTRLLASCSDDRNILLWDVSGVNTSDPSLERVGTCLAKTTAHGSRIWAVRFIDSGDNEKYSMISFGEDGTALLWSLCPLKTTNEIDNNLSLSFDQRAKCSFHYGKNIWAQSIYSRLDEVQVIATGGADGRIVIFHIATDICTDDTRHNQSTMAEALESARSSEKDVVLAENSAKTYKRRIFDAMIGDWKLSRTIKSAVPTHPSGRLQGSASLLLRDVTDDSFDRECIYSEKGDFVTDMGFTMKATRQYVYRYQERSDEISIWFVKTDGETVDYIFHNLDFEEEASFNDLLENKPVSSDFSAAGHHFCKPDTYYPEYAFHFVGDALSTWHIKYKVKGPQKDYISEAIYSRGPSIDRESSARGLSDLSISDKIRLIPEMSLKDAFKSYVWISKVEVLAVTELGNLLLGHLSEDKEKTGSSRPSPTCRRPAKPSMVWEFVGHSDSLQSRSMMSSVAPLGMAFLTGTDGIIYAYRHATRKLTVLHEGSGKIGYLAAQLLKRNIRELQQDLTYISLVFRVLGARSLEVFLITPGDASTSPEISSRLVCESDANDTPPNREFVTTSSLYLEDEQLLLEGSRNGALRIRSLIQNHTWEYPGHHESNAITAIVYLSQNSQRCGVYFLTTGRNGKYAYHELYYKDLPSFAIELSTIHVASSPFGPNIEGAHINQLTKELILWGFNSTRFVVWNESAKSETIAVECGGAHRNWSYAHHDDTGGGNLVWTKASICNVYYQTQTSHRVLQSGGHGREIKAIAISPIVATGHNGEISRLIATGAEDTGIHLFSQGADGFHCLNTMTGHTTGVQHLQWSRDGRWLFSAGGCEEFFAWQIRWLDGRPCVVCYAQCPSTTHEKDLRIMDFVVEIGSISTNDQFGYEYIISVAYSDASIRLWGFGPRNPDVDVGNKGFAVLCSASYGTSCLTQLCSLRLDEAKTLCTASSDGHLALWHSETPSYTDLIQFSSHAVHQNSIKSLLLIKVLVNPTRSSSRAVQKPGQESIDEYIIITGGDDQALALTILAYPQTNKNDPPPRPRLATLLIPNAHASAITGIAYLGHIAGGVTHRFATVGNDQRLKTWAIDLDEAREGVDAVRMKKLGDMHTGVADASSLKAYEDENGVWRVLVAGIGMECWKLAKGSQVWKE